MQNVIALIWDFDKTLVDGYMQDPIFEEYGVDAKEYWRKVNSLPAEYLKQGIRVNPDTAYLLQFTRDARNGLFKGLNNSKLREYGAKQRFYAGIPAFLAYCKDLLNTDEECQEFNIRVEHYIVSTGFAEVIRGSSVSPLVDGIWGCELIDATDDKGNSFINEPCYTIDNTTKTRALFEINKGVNKKPEVNVNTKMNDGQKRVSFRNMIYIADGPSDVPAFSVIKKNGGTTFAVYPSNNVAALKQVDQLRREGRVDFFAEADYREGTTTFNWLTTQIISLSDFIKQEEKNRLAVKSTGPVHLPEK